MGNLCLRNIKPKTTKLHDEDDVQVTVSPKEIFDSEVLKWEEKQKERQNEILSKLREDFEHRPDIFVLNMLVVSTQFFKNFDKQRREILNTTLGREKHFNEKLASSKRRVLFMGGLEEITGTHVLYQDPESSMLEMPTRLQLFIIQENVQVFGEDQIEDLLTAKYEDEEDPVYRVTEEPSKRHPGYVRLRCTDAFPDLSRSNTYEDIYSILPKPNENEPDPVMDIRPIRRSSVLSQEDLGDLYETAPGMGSTFQDTIPPKPLNDNPRAGDVSGSQWGDRVESSTINNAQGLKERRPSGLFPKMNPGMERVLLMKSKPNNKFDPMAEQFDRLNAALSKIEEGDSASDLSDHESVHSISVNSNTSSNTMKNMKDYEEEEEAIYQTLPLKEVIPQPYQNHDHDNGTNGNQALSLTIQRDCFLSKKIKMRSVNDAYGIESNSELRTYLSSSRYLDVFEEQFLHLLETLQKSYLYESCEMQTPAIHVTDTVVEKYGPKFNTEYIPSLMVKRWPNCAFEWKWRTRNPKIDTVSQTIYKWPLDRKIEEVSHLGCNLVPIGYYNPKEPTRTMEIEWQIQFTRAETSLLKSLGHSQLRILLLAEVLIRDHLGEKTQLRTQHLRYILFYMCEHNMKDWSEERLGNKLKEFLKSLYGCLSNENFPHYFVSKCNMTDSFPLKDLRFIQATVKKMTENLPVYLMQTLHRLRMAEDFYPRLDIKKLYKIVTPKIYHGNLAQSLIGMQINVHSPRESESSGEDSEEDVALKKKLKAEYRRRQDKSQGSTKTDTPRKKGLNLETKIQMLTDNRAEDVLKYFADHFLEMAKLSNKFKAFPQAYMYLYLAGHMATLLGEYNCSEESRHYRDIIEKLTDTSRVGIGEILGAPPKGTDFDDEVMTKEPKGSNWELKDQKERSENTVDKSERKEMKKVNLSSKTVAFSLMSLENSDPSRRHSGSDDDDVFNNDKLEMFASSRDKTSDVQFEKRSDVQFEKRSGVQFEKRSGVQFEKRSDVQFEKRSDVQFEKHSDVQFEKRVTGREKPYPHSPSPEPERENSVPRYTDRPIPNNYDNFRKLTHEQQPSSKHESKSALNYSKAPLPELKYNEPPPNHTTNHHGVRKSSETLSDVLKDLDFTLANVHISNFDRVSIASTRTLDSRDEKSTRGRLSLDSTGSCDITRL